MRGGLRGAEGDLVGMREAEGNCGKLRLAMGGHICLYTGGQIFLLGELTNRGIP